MDNSTTKAREIMDSFFGSDDKRSWYNFKVGKVINGNLMGNYAALDNIITNEETGRVLMRFCVKGHNIDIVFKPEDSIVISSSIIDDNPISVDTLEEGLKLISKAAEEKDM